MRVLHHLAIASSAVLVLSGCGGDGDGPVAQADCADPYPSQPITLLVPYSAGGPTDIAARAVGQRLEETFDETVIVENRPGASGSTAYLELISAEPDGHTLSMFALPTAVLNYLVNEVGYTAEDLVPVGSVTRVPSAIVVPANSEFDDLEALFAAAQQDPDAVSIGTPGATNTHAAETRRITQLYDVPLTVVPFEGGSEVRTALLGGNVSAGCSHVSLDILPSIESGDLRVLAVGSAERLDYIDAPTFVELGYPELTQSTTTFGVAAPAGICDATVEELESAIRDAVADPAVVEQLDARYVDAFMGREELEELFTDTQETFEDTPLN